MTYASFADAPAGSSQPATSAYTPPPAPAAPYTTTPYTAPPASPATSSASSSSSNGPVTGTPPPYATTTPGFGSGGGSPAYGTQSPSIFGTGTYTTPLYPINDTAITGTPSQGASTNYGDNSVWSNLSNELAAAPNQGAGMAVSPTANAASYQAATGQAAQAQAAQAGYATSQAAQAQAAQTAAAQGGYALGSPAQAAGYATSQAAQGGYAQAAGVPLSVGGNTIQNQANLANTLNVQANGGGVSPADLQLQQGAGANLAAQLAALGSQRGTTDAALAQRSAADSAASSGATLNQQMGIQRAQETLQAQQAENAVLTAQGSQAAGINATAANLTQQTNLTNSAQAQQAILANTQNVEQTALQNAANAQGTTVANLSAAQQTAIANEANAQASTMQNTQNVQAANLANQAASQQTSLTNADLATQTAQANAANAQQSDIANLSAAQQTALANQSATNAMTGLNVGALNTAAGTNAGLAEQTNLANLTAAQQTTLANQQTQLANSQLYDNEINAVLGAQAGIAASDKAAALSDETLQVTQLGNAGQTNEQGFAAGAQANSNLLGTVAQIGTTGLVAGVNAAAKTPSAAAAPPAVNTTVAATDPITGGPDFGFTGTLPAGTVSAPPASIPYGVTAPTPTFALSDENLKTGIEGGNPMMQSFLQSYRKATAGDDSSSPPINVSEGQGFRNPTYGRTTGTAGKPGLGGTIGSAAGGALGSAGGAALGAAAGTAVLPGIGTLIGGIGGAILGGLGGSAAGGAAGNAIAPGSPGSAGQIVQTSPGSGDTIRASVTPEPDPTMALSDDNEKQAVTSGNRGMQAFLQQANAQTGAQNTSGANNNAFMSSALPPQSQVNTQAPTAGVGPFAAPTAPLIAPNPGAVSAPPFTAQSVSNPGAPQTTGGPTGYGYTPGSSYGGGFANGSGSMGGSSGGGYGGGGFTPGAASGRSSIPGQIPQIPYTTGPSLPAQSAAQASPTLSYVTPQAPTPPTQIAYSPTAPVLDSNRVMPMMVTSDEDEKEKTTDPASVQKMLDQLSAYQYRYKNPNAPGAMPGQRLGVMAQDLERSKLGASFVRDTPQGKMVDYGQMAGTQLAASAMLNDRLDQHEAMLKQLTGRA